MLGVELLVLTAMPGTQAAVKAGQGPEADLSDQPHALFNGRAPGVGVKCYAGQCRLRNSRHASGV